MSKKDDRKKVSDGNYFTKKDYTYWIMFLSLIIILLLVWKWDNEQQLTNQISLVGSVSSILLALVAIGYAFFQTQRNSNENNLMLGTLMKINDEINKLESVNSSLKMIKTDLINMKEESSLFQEKMEIDISKLRSFLEDESWIDAIDLERDKEEKVDLKDILKREYEKHIDKNLDKAFKIDNEIMAVILNHIGKLSLGERIDEDEIFRSLTNKGIKVSKYEIFNELKRLNNKGIVSFVKDNDSKNSLYTIKNSDIEPIKFAD